MDLTRFDLPIISRGYAWWYVDALSDDGRFGLTLIAMLGSVFSPFYTAARARGEPVDPMDHSVMNVALYTPHGRWWSLDERKRTTVHREARSLSLGASVLRWEGDTLVIDLEERSTPFLPMRPLGDRRIVGSVRVRTRVRTEAPMALDGDGAHWWCPLAPLCRVEVALREPLLQWRGEGYHDANAGTAPLEDTFRAWTWSRASTPEGSVILYDATLRNGKHLAHARLVSSSGVCDSVDAPTRLRLPSGRWGVSRETRVERGGEARVRNTLEDSPFYVRSVLDARLRGHRTLAFHESLDLERFERGWVQFLLPFKTRRV